jgi:hypothetical protein
MKRLVGLLTVGTLLLMACGGGSETATTTTAETDGEPRNFSDWCEGANWVNDEVDALSASSLALEERLRRQFTGELFATQIELLRNSPSDISATANTLADGILEVRDVLVEVDFILFALTDEQSAIFDSESLDRADDLFEEYLEAECGISDDETESAERLPLSQAEVDAVLDGPDRAGTLGALMDLGVEEDVAECIMTEVLLTAMDIDGAVDQEMIDVMTGCGLTLEQLAAIGLGVDEDEVSDAAGLDQLRAVVSPELIQTLNASQQARDAITAALVAQGLAQDDAACIVENLSTIEDAAVFDDLSGFVALLEGCGMTLEELANLSQ